jgi:transposase
LEDFSGYVAADELYDGPFCVLSIVDNRSFKRLGYKVLEKSPTQEDITAFLENFKAKLDERALSVKGITTDGSPLYPKPIAAIFPQATHQICRFHVLADITKAVLHAVAQVRKELKAQIPKRRRGRPGKRHRKLTRRIERACKRISALFEHRHLFVQKQLSEKEQQLLEKITAGLPQLRVLRVIMNTVYGLFDRRCRSARALAKLAELRRRVRRFAQLRRSLAALFSANLEKALWFLDDKLLPSTSNAVERSNRRHRKMQKSIYCVRTIGQVRGRIALDMQRDQHQPDRHTTVRTLHIDRSNPPHPLRETG